MTLGDNLLARIAQSGPMTVADYMTECLLHPQFGYYATRDPLGTAGDFITAPEISQMFGELIGLSLAQAWIDQGSPARFTLAEPDLDVARSWLISCAQPVRCRGSVRRPNCADRGQPGTARDPARNAE